jgi:NitT/TauT family transport system permease protein
VLWPYTLSAPFRPNAKVNSEPLIIMVWVLLFLVGWQFFRPTVFPGPVDVLRAVPDLFGDGFGADLWTSWTINLEALCLSALIGLPLAWLSRLPVIAPLTATTAKLRFVGSAVFYLPLLLTMGSGHEVKLGLLTLGSLFYLVTTMAGVVQTIPDFRYDDAKTLRIGDWLSIWYVNIRGTVPETIRALRDNAGMGWSMLMFVEGVVRSEGGVGVIILNAQKHTNYDQFFAAALIIVAVGIGQDWLLGQLEKVVCPYA